VTVDKVGRYSVYDAIASGGMGSVHLARLTGSHGFGKIVAIKRLHGKLAKNQELVADFAEEARLGARIRHPNVVPVSDVVFERGELYLVMDYVHGVSLATLTRRAKLHNQPLPRNVVLSIVIAVLDGLSAAHQAKDERGKPLGLVHRDVSQQNVLVGADGVARVVDLGIAQTVQKSVSPENEASVHGKLGYMAPEQVRGDDIDQRADVWAASVVLWELLTGARLFTGNDEWTVAQKVLERPIDAPGRVVKGIPAELDTLVLRGLTRDRVRRFATAHEMARALESVETPASTSEVGRWVKELASDELERLDGIVSDIEREASESRPDAEGSPRIALVGLVVAIALVIGWIVIQPPPRSTHHPDEPKRTLLPKSGLPMTMTSGPTSAAPSPSAAPSASSPAAVPGVRVPPKPSARAPDCDPPYVVDKEGFQRMKPECLKR
jgi:eukaryotic-like serine/threonine-protein kinase